MFLFSFIQIVFTWLKMLNNLAILSCNAHGLLFICEGSAYQILRHRSYIYALNAIQKD